MSNCAGPGCDKAGIHKCSKCLRELYCCSACQKADWKSHKLICKILRKLSHQLQPFIEVMGIIEEVDRGKPKRSDLEMRVLKHLISYIEYQFPNRIAGSDYREREDGERMGNWYFEIELLIPMYDALISIYQCDESHGMMDASNLIFPCVVKILDLLRPWSENLDLNPTRQIDSLNKDQMQRLLTILSRNQRRISLICMHRNQYDQAERHCQLSISYSRLYDGKEEDKADLLCKALEACVSLRTTQGRYGDAVIFAEEAYNCVAVVYDPVHPEVQKAAGKLIECLNQTGDLYNAERFAQATLDSLKDPANGLDQESEEVAKGYYDLASVINQQEEDFGKAEMLARESLRIRSKQYRYDHQTIGVTVGLLASILASSGNLGHETEELYERCLAICNKHEGLNGKNTANINFNVGLFYQKLAELQKTTEKKTDYLRISFGNYKESLRIFTKILGPDNLRTIVASSNVSFISNKLSEG